jgi:carboxylesterase
MINRDLIAGSEPFLRLGRGETGRIGCVLIQGFSGTPFEMLGLGEALAGAGYAVLGVRLAHHGTAAADMNRSRWWDWYYSALDGCHLLRGICEQVVVIGLSMGGVTALSLAANFPVAGVVCMSTPAVYMDKEWQMKLARVFWRLKPLIDKPQEEEKEPWPSYKAIPVRSAGELLDYNRQLVEVLPKITVPALLLHSADDAKVPPKNLDFIFDLIQSADKKKLLLEAGGHVMTEGEARERVYQEVIAFLDRLSG